MNKELKDKWTEMVYDEALNTPTEWLYTLLNPTDKREFFKIVGTIVEQHMPNDASENQIWASSYLTQFKMTAVEYLIELENENNKISTLIQPDTTHLKPEIVYYNYTTTTETK